jgi:hypothetical protein
MTTESRELAVYIENNGNLYRQQTTPIIKNLKRKIAKGVYDATKALILWKHLADSGAKLYVKEFGGKWDEIFSVADRKLAAKELAEYYTEELHENPKRRTKRKSSKGRGKVTRLKRNPPFGKTKRTGARHRDQRRIPTALEVNQMASSLGLRSKSLDELITMYNKHRKMPASNFIAKVIAEASKQVAITKGAKVVTK